MAKVLDGFGKMIQGNPLGAAYNILSSGNSAQDDYLRSFDNAMAKQMELYQLVIEKKQQMNEMKSLMSLASSVTEKVT